MGYPTFEFIQFLCVKNLENPPSLSDVFEKSSRVTSDIFNFNLYKCLKYKNLDFLKLSWLLQNTGITSINPYRMFFYVVLTFIFALLYPFLCLSNIMLKCLITLQKIARICVVSEHEIFQFVHQYFSREIFTFSNHIYSETKTKN